MEKPLSIKREDFATALITLINECGLPPFVVSEIMRGMTEQVSRLAQQQYEADKKAWEEYLKQEVKEDG